MNLTSSSPGAPASLLEQALANAHGQGRAALAAYLPADYPTPAHTTIRTQST
ncbi:MULTISPECIES: hypothetical protein [unclassified Streptomyces]|uniref:hypothetical protein n=1 Tax=unclassified Streptomyces TaxID=2593676 RepID=UPI00342E803F